MAKTKRSSRRWIICAKHGDLVSMDDGTGCPQCESEAKAPRRESEPSDFERDKRGGFDRMRRGGLTR